MKKLNMISTITLSLFGLVFVFGGCSDALTSTNVQMNSGHFVSVFDKSINYKCAEKVKALSKGGEFECQSFPIAFYMEDVKLGEISSIHNDGYVFPQDIIVLEEMGAVYTSDDRMMFGSLQE